MVTRAIQKITSWSASRYRDYETCPALAKYKHIDKLKEPGNAAMQRGTAIHLIAENYIKGVLPAKIPKELKLFAEEFKKLRLLYKKKTFPMIVEDQWGFDRAWEECAWNDWDNCWLRVKLDVGFYLEANKLFIVDNKTGKMSEYKNVEYLEALELYGTAGLIMSSVDEVEVYPQLWYLDQGIIYTGPDKEPLRYTRADLPALKAKWEKRIKPMMNDTTFAPKPGRNCQWCHFSAAKKGPCKF